MHRRAWTVVALLMMTGGVAAFLDIPRETTFFTFHSSGRPPPETFFWLPWYRVLAVAVTLLGLLVLTATLAHAVGVRRGRSLPGGHSPGGSSSE